ncbi:MAG TPA: hypothetical protein VFA75_20845 [Nevskia sp.]|nr:hypothetical protein [Nevskia sp.]
MLAHGVALIRTSPLRLLLAGAGSLLLAACGGGGGNISVGPGGGSSGGSSGGVLQGTFFGYTGNSTRGFPAPSTQQDVVFGVIASDGNGFLADTQTNGSQAIFNLEVASSTGSSTIGGFFTAYAGGTGNLGDGTTQIVVDANLSGTSSSSGNGLQAALSFPFPGGYSNSAHVILDNPALSSSAIPAGTYTATTGPSAVAAKGFPTVATTYTVNFSSSTSFTLSSASGCNFSGTATPDGTYNVSHLMATGTCSTGSIALSGLASHLPASGHSPLGGSLTADTLVMELDDASNGSVAQHQYALALVATRQ